MAAGYLSDAVQGCPEIRCLPGIVGEALGDDQDSVVRGMEHACQVEICNEEADLPRSISDGQPEEIRELAGACETAKGLVGSRSRRAAASRNSALRTSNDAQMGGAIMSGLGAGHALCDWLSCRRLVRAGRTVTPAAVSVSANVHWVSPPLPDLHSPRESSSANADAVRASLW